MWQRLDNRLGSHTLLMVVWAVLCLPNLGGPSLWDIDEGNNAEASQEMLVSGNWVVPTFNDKLREDKPALLYWLQATAYDRCGVNEWSARLPSALASLFAVLATCELGRRLFGASAGLLAGLVLASAVQFCAAAHFANPDALLNLFTLLTLLCFWNHYRRPHGWWLLAAGAASGLGVLAKGPIGLVLPSAVGVLFLAWRRELRRLWDLRVLGGTVVFLLVAVPWYVWVALETKGQWLVGFLWNHNVKRGLGAMENHGGPFFYYLLVLMAGLAPWSIFLGPTAWYAIKRLRQPEEEPHAPRDSRAVFQFLLCWIGVYFVFFSVVRTKLPNYVLPLYPAAALLTGCFLDHWRRGRVMLPAWVMRVSLISLALLGGGVSLGLLIAADPLHLPFMRGRGVPGLEAWSWLGVVFMAGAALAWWCHRRERRGGLIAVVALSGVLLSGLIAGWGVEAVDRCKAPRALVAALPEDHLRREVRVAAYDYFQPSLVFYCRREVIRPEWQEQAIEFLRGPLPAYLFVPAATWEQMRPRVPVPCRLVARHRDLYDNTDIVLVTNEAACGLALPAKPQAASSVTSATAPPP